MSANEIEMKLEVVVVPVSDVDRAKKFYAGLGWRLDADFRREHHAGRANWPECYAAYMVAEQAGVELPL